MVSPFFRVIVTVGLVVSITGSDVAVSYELGADFC
jgi:hypothetical protein